MLPRDDHGRIFLKGVPRPQLLEWAGAQGLRPGQADALWAALYRKLRSDFATMPELDRAARDGLAAVARLDVLRLEAVKQAADGTSKLVFQTDDGAAVESVLIPGPERATLCVSSQVGCAMNCQFCLTATMGLARNLSAAEIVDQLVIARRRFPDVWISNVVFMGMGEPLHNLDQVLPAIAVMVDDHGLGLSHRRVTVSTSGLVPQIRRLVAESPAQLAVSINATTDEVRDAIMPVNRKYPLAVLFAALRELPLARRARVTLEYVLLAGVNDSLADAERLAELVRGLPCKLNLIPWNPHPGSEFRRPEPEQVAAFKAHLQGLRLNTSIRATRGDDTMAACGQLGRAPAESPRRTRRPHGLPVIAS
ncbi:23S rRNA m(2)A-2503 methyltransferase [Nannocystis exedens]|uniref:Probable dual-specificity RNA methyltransferase RlmN n=1 Tax=Nannocystis exedens TaxID=54 RepID=A0A1I1VTI5_9BACT|nr:23S rRNA (adenine(2503)-C(2))-methyltransferase RlmN [Nannocystis exedens]PCC72841.1 50S rRNA methyltransferase [Nannocystis exedens]SFD86412.1 23S rRNA m(2)A-2503 methyltransferase [Nannocystis exedens]